MLETNKLILCVCIAIITLIGRAGLGLLSGGLENDLSFLVCRIEEVGPLLLYMHSRLKPPRASRMDEHTEPERRGVRRFYSSQHCASRHRPSPEASHGNGRPEGLILPSSVRKKQLGNESNQRQGGLLPSCGTAGKARKRLWSGMVSPLHVIKTKPGAPEDGRAPPRK